MNGDSIDIRAWHHALAAHPITVVSFEACRDRVRIVAQAAAPTIAIPVTLVATVSPQWYDVFDYTLEPHPVQAGRTGLVRVVELLRASRPGDPLLTRDVIKSSK